jgi:aminopeptidase N
VNLSPGLNFGAGCHVLARDRINAALIPVEDIVKKVFSLFVFLLASISIACAQRLPELAVPENYQLTFSPDFTKDNFAGVETIKLNVLKPTTQIVLNAAEIEFEDVAITAKGGTHKAKVSLDKEKEQATLLFDATIPSGPATLQIKYTGILNDKLRGFYLGKDEQGHKYAATQLEAQDARRAFPSFDEPAYKATFDITAIAPKGMVAISNGKVVSDTPGPGDDKHTVRFATSAKMSSYLAALVVGDFEYIEGSADGIPIRVYTVPGKKELGRFGLETAEYVLHYYDQYFAVKYPYGKLDLIGLPDFSAGAMENTACITFREILLLADDKTSLDLRKTVASVIAHEMAHQWFGDLVTMQWWNDLWLNEGFATWMSSKPLAAWKPEWNEPLDDTQSMAGAMNADSLVNTHPIRQDAQTSAEMVENADAITYSKTAAVLRMIEAYVGPEAFRSGVNAYLQQHEYANATAVDFWNAQTKSSGKPIDKIMPAYIDQAGTPLVSVHSGCSGNAETVSLDQQRYFFDRAKFEAGSKELWEIPVCMKAASGGNSGEGCELLVQKQHSTSLKECSPWIYANAGAKGVYRSGYSSAAVRAMAAIAETALTPSERILLQSDVWASVRVNREPIGDYLALAEGLQADRNPAVMDEMIGVLDNIDRHLTTDSDRAAFEAWVRRLLAPAVRDIGWDAKPGESAEIGSLRARLMVAQGYVGRDPQVVALAQKLANQVMGNPDSVDRELAFSAMLIATRDGDAGFYDKVMAALKTAKTPEEYYLYQGALSGFSDPALLQRTLNYAMSPDARSQDSPGLIGQTLGNPAGQKITWDFIRANWDKIEKLGGAFGGASIVQSTSSFCDTAMRDQAMEFFTAHHSPAFERSLKQAQERVNYCVDLKAQQSNQLAAWLQGRGNQGGD